MNDLIDNLRVVETLELITPRELKNQISWDDVAFHIESSRNTISDIIHWNDSRLLTVVWPCSIHNTDEALEYAKWLSDIKIKFPNLYLVMRTYFEKPRTTIWWKGLINDPYLDGSEDMVEWLKKARSLLYEINKLDLPTATEFLDPIVSQYIADMVSWGAVWARTTESQTHRQMASWLSMPVWFKNGTDWDIQIAIDALGAASNPHKFLWINDDWKVSIIKATWNSDGHVILRWWKNKLTNYDIESIRKITTMLKEMWINPNVMVDVSHANSFKKHEEQVIVSKEVAGQIALWNEQIMWVMIESNLVEWNQSFTPWKNDPKSLVKWKSITDECINLNQTEDVLWELDYAASKRKKWISSQERLRDSLKALPIR